MSSPAHSPFQAIVGIAAGIPGYFVAKWAYLATMTPDQFTAWTVAICGALYTVGWTIKSLFGSGGLFTKQPEPLPNGKSYQPPKKSHRPPDKVS